MVPPSATIQSYAHMCGWLQVVFEDFGFQSLCSCPAPLLSLQHMKNTAQPLPAHQAGCALVLDAGFSFTHAVPIFSNVVLDSGVRRQNLGGKVLTNYLKELVSYRQGAPGLTTRHLSRHRRPVGRTSETRLGRLHRRTGRTTLGTRADISDTAGRSSLRRAVVGTNHPSRVLRLPPPHRASSRAGVMGISVASAVVISDEG